MLKKTILIICLAAYSCVFNALSNSVSDIDAVEPFLDGVILSKLNDKNIAGATLAVVKDGEVTLVKGYGYSDFANRVPVDADESLFRIASISKLFVWLAVMQQVEQGNIDLKKDINDYLVDFKVPTTYEGPVTMTHLMSHTAGFEDKFIKLFTIDEQELKPFSEVLASQIPRRVRPAGVHASYSNHGTAIAAHVVEIVSGLSWYEYVEKNIFEPLGMFSTTFRQPLPSSLSPRMSKGYTHSGGRMIEKPFEFIPLSPAGSVTTSAPDMTTFMLMLLNRGQWNEVSIIDTATFDLMMKPVMQHADLVNPCMHGFLDYSRKGVKIIGHGGDTFWFHSLLAVIPEHDTGLFLSFNSEGGGGTYVEVLDKFIDYFISDTFEVYPTIELSVEELAEFEGEYASNRRPHSDYLKISTLTSRTFITAEQGRLRVERGGKVSFWNPIGNLAFQKENEADILVFERNMEGEIAHAFDGARAIFVLDKMLLWQRVQFHTSILFAALILSAFTLVYWPSVYIVRRRYQPMSIAPRTIPPGSKLTAWLAALLLLVFYFGMYGMLSDIEALVFTIPSALKFYLIIPFVVIVLTLIMIYHTWHLWAYRGTRVRSRLFYTVLLLVNFMAIWQMFYWNFIGWNY